MPNCRLMDFEAPLQAAEDTVTVGLPFKAYESEDGATAPYYGYGSHQHLRIGALG